MRDRIWNEKKVSINNDPEVSKRKILNQESTASGNSKENQDQIQRALRQKPKYLEVVSDTTLLLKPPDCSQAFKLKHYDTTQHVFKKVFNSMCSTQKQVFEAIASALVVDLVQGKSGLIFAYGVVKNFTMTGKPGNPGILFRSLAMLFDSIEEFQAPKYVFRKDKTTFKIFSRASAEKRTRNELQQHKIKSLSRHHTLLSAMELSDLHDVVASVDTTKMFSVFVSYIEIYNNYVYDLLEEPVYDIRGSQQPSRQAQLREDAAHHVHVCGVTQVEVKSAREAFELVCLGQKRLHVAKTHINHMSSRGHSVFTITLVQAPLHQTKDVVSAQLCLVDLAGSERISRTDMRGGALREACYINQSLTVLKACMQTLRDNQLKKTKKVVPYREAKLSRLFKNYIDRSGNVRMVVCINQEEAYYDETLHVLKFIDKVKDML